MGKLTKLKEIFSKENIKKGVRLGVLTAGIAFASIGFTSCGDIVNGPIDPETDYCEICEGIQDEYHEHEQPTPEPEPEKEKCNQDGCKFKENGTEFEKGTHTTHDYCDKYGCADEDNKTDNNPHEHCKDTNCKNKTAYTDNHDHDYCGLSDEVCFGTDKTTNREHIHDYCREDNCNGSTHMGTDHPTAGYESWFQEATIGGENSPIKIRYVDDLAYNTAHPGFSLTTNTVADKLNDFQDQYQKYIENLTFSDAFKAKFSDAFDENGKLKINFADFFDNSDISTSGKIRYQRSFDPLIGHYDQDNKSTNGSLNDICKPMIEEITKNIGISGDDYLDTEMFYLYNSAIYVDAYNYAYSNIDTYTPKKEYIQERLDAANFATGNNYKIYQEDGTIHEEALQRYNDMKSAAVTRFNDQGTDITKEDVDNVMIFTSTISTIEGTHDLSITWNTIKDANAEDNEKHGSANCATNEMGDVILNEQSKLTAMVSPAKLNKSIFSQDMGRELC